MTPFYDITLYCMAFSDMTFLQNSGRILPGFMEKSKKKATQWGLNLGPLDHHANALIIELSQHLVAKFDSENDQKSKIWSAAWIKAHFINLLPNIYLPRAVSRTLELWSRGSGFNPH